MFPSATPRLLVATTLLVASLACTCRESEGEGGGEPETSAGHGAKGKAPHDPAEPPTEHEVEMPPGVVYLGENRWRVQRKAVDRYIENPEKLGCSAREKGKGYELVGVKPIDQAYALGARNKDLVLSINGKSLDDSSDLINLYLSLSDAKKLTVVLERQGAKLTHVYEIEG